MRRENHLIANLLTDADQHNDKQVRLAVYHGIASYTVFTTIGGDYPIRTVRPAPPRADSVVRIHLANLGLLFMPAATRHLTILDSFLSYSQARSRTLWRTICASAR
jgi:hypothetical protein